MEDDGAPWAITNMQVQNTSKKEPKNHAVCTAQDQIYHNQSPTPNQRIDKYMLVINVVVDGSK